MKPICVVGGGGYVGLGYAVALAELGHQVVGLDIDATRVERLNRGDWACNAIVGDDQDQVRVNDLGPRECCWT